MASLKKRGPYYYGRWQKMVEGKRVEVKKSLGLTNRTDAEEALEKLERLEVHDLIDPYDEDFDPQKALGQLSLEKIDISKLSENKRELVRKIVGALEDVNEQENERKKYLIRLIENSSI